MNRRISRIASMICVLLALMTVHTRGEVYHSKESALRLAFPGADAIEKRELFLGGEEAERAEKLAGARLPSRLVTVYVGRANGDIVGYAFIETHNVRSLPETILVTLDPGGRTRVVHILAFHEPPEYAPTARWLQQFEGRPLDDELSIRGEVDGITGATLTATAITAAVRRILAVYQVALAGSSDAEAGAGGAASPSSSSGTGQ